eukprot:4198470-Pleurochrysis_carterae.AAC.3
MASRRGAERCRGTTTARCARSTGPCQVGESRAASGSASQSWASGHNLQRTFEAELSSWGAREGGLKLVTFRIFSSSKRWHRLLAARGLAGTGLGHFEIAWPVMSYGLSLALLDIFVYQYYKHGILTARWLPGMMWLACNCLSKDRAV